LAYGDCPDDEALLQQWSEFCDRLKLAGQLVFKDANPPRAVHRADGFRYLAQNLGQAFGLALETRDTKYPQLFAFSHPNLHLASDSADCTYIHAAHLPAVATRLVPLAEVPAAMHESSRRISQAERVRELKRRFNAIRRRFRL
jgi:hypothetical protein